ncbi:NAD(P)-dependent dehydrogenase, short-chain alcohol dehydrogenase family [Verrucomicrobium sp. GAS474]|uniref:SDR family oxidoreductase n=1 Tax=Verrucomicrobium sp. GAS474 TaxID=1882831 RepID=UPI000879BA87|nr:SDR family oxidoreductase [Verrucomicrobium sp. GAS474]SDT94527.1 NAD(P)-dependent dehydrogenase, short-chain alcohol dehydrogenase family [Verrucomicrobium sp. GAS474]
MASPQKPTLLILSISSDIGAQLALRYLAEGWRVVGTYRGKSNLDLFKGRKDVALFRCDLKSKPSIACFAAAYKELGWKWTTFISSAGQLSPIAPFLNSNPDAWEDSILINSVRQLRILHAIYPLRKKSEIAKAVFFVGGGINNAFTNYSSYCAGKILLLKMCELLDDECPDLHVAIFGTGWVKTKIHNQTLHARCSSGDNYERTLQFLQKGAKGTSFDDIHQCIKWALSQKRALTGGRNFSIVHDAWRDGGDRLIFELSQDLNKFKLRRHDG